MTRRRHHGDEADAERLSAAFIAQFGFTLERPSKAERRHGRTPDFRVLRAGQPCFFAEVKSVRGGDWLDRRLNQEPPGTLVGGVRPDPIFNRLTKDIHEAVRQFDAVNDTRQHPNVLALVNYDPICGFSDLLAVVTGNFYADDGRSHPIYRQYSEGRMKNDRLRVDLYLWLDSRGEHHFLFSRVDASHYSALCEWFGEDPDTIKTI